MNRLITIVAITVTALIISAIFNREKTLEGVKKGMKMLLDILPSFLVVIILVSIFLYILPKEVLIKYLGAKSGVIGMIIAAIIGSIALIPGFIAYPLGAILLKSGVTYEVLSIFITTLMMVGVLTLPVEIKYFGARVAILRNLLSFIGAIVVGIIMGLIL